MTSLYNCRELLARSRSRSELACEKPFTLSLGEARAFYRHFLRAVRYSGISRRFGDRKNEKRKKGGEDDRSVRQKRNIVLICMIDARGEFVLRPR